jgi:transcription initiation factor TFIIB
MPRECPECSSSKVSKRRGELYCRNCGLVLEDQEIDTSKEYRVFDESDQGKERSGENLTYTKDDKGLGTEIGNSSDLYNIPGSKRSKFYRMKKWDKRSQRNGDREILRSLNNIVYALNLPDMVAEEAARLCVKARENGLVRGRKTEVVSAAIVYLVSRNNGVPRTLTETAEVINEEERIVGKNYRYIARKLGLDIRPVKPTKLLPRYASNLGISGEVEGRVRSVIERGREKNFLAGRKPSSVISGAMYYVSCVDELGITQKSISEACGVTEVTVRKLSNLFDENLELERREVSVKNARA